MYFDKNRKKAIVFIVSKEEVDSLEIINYLLSENNILQSNLLQLTKVGYSEKIIITCFKNENIDKSRIVYFLNDFLDILNELETGKYIVKTEANVEDINEGDVLLELGNRLPRQMNQQELKNFNLEQTLGFQRNSIIKATPKLKTLLENNYRTDDEIRYERTSTLAEQNASNSSSILKANKLNLALSILAILSALLFNYQSCNSTQKTINTLSGIENSTGTLSTNLNSVNEKFKEFPKTISDFSSTIINLNKTIEVQQESLKENTERLSETVLSFKNNINSFEESINQYKIQLDKIIQQTDTQLEIWKKQQEVLKNEFTRRTNLVINNISFDFDSTKNMCRLSRFELLNKGDIEAKIDYLLFYIDTNSSIEIVETPMGLRKLEVQNNKIKYANYRSSNVVQPEAYIFYKPKLYYLFESRNSEKIVVQVFYTSKYDSGKKEFEISLKECK